MERKQIEDRVIEILKETLAVDSIELNNKLVDNIYMDSLDGAEIIMQLENEFNIAIPEDKANDFIVVDDFVKCVEELIAEKDGQK